MADIKVRVGQQNAVKVISSLSGSAGGRAVSAENVIGGIASVRELYVSGISTIVGFATFRDGATFAGILTANTGINVLGVSTFVGVSTFRNDVYIGGDLYVNDDIFFDEFTARNARITGIATITGGLYYGPYYTNGMPYFNSSGLMVSTQSPQNGIDDSNYIMTTDGSGVPTWSGAIDGGFY